MSTYLHMYRYVCLCVCVCVRNTQQADPNARAKCQRLSLCLHAAALAWPDLAPAPARPSLAWPGLARTMAGFEHSNEFHNIRGKSTCTTARQRLSLSLKELVKKNNTLCFIQEDIERT